MLATKASLPGKFSGKKCDFADWKAQWEYWVTVMTAGNAPQDDHLILANLVKVLDDGNSMDLRDKIIRDPKLKYAKYWREFLDRQERNCATNLRNTLNNLKLESKGKLNFSETQKFVTNFRRIAVGIPNLSPEEAFAILMKAIPYPVAQKLQTENFRKRERELYKIQGLGQVGIGNFAGFIMQQLDGSPKTFCKKGDDFLVEIFPEQRRKILGLNGEAVQGIGRITVESTTDQMSMERALEKLLAYVEEQEELEETRKGLGKGVYNIQTHREKPLEENPVEEVETAAIPVQKNSPGKGKGRGTWKGSWRGNPPSNQPQGRQATPTGNSANANSKGGAGHSETTLRVQNPPLPG